jgi:hypothetical protein
VGDGTSIPNDRGRLRQAFQLVRALVRHHKRTFFTAVAGAAVFAACTVLSAMVVRLITDEVIGPRFNEGSVSARKVVVVLGALIVIGFVRAAGVVVRRTWAGRTTWRVTESLTTESTASPRNRRRGIVARAPTIITLVSTPSCHCSLGRCRSPPGVVVLVGLSSVWLLLTDLPLGLAAVAVFPGLIALNVGYQRRVDRYYKMRRTSWASSVPPCTASMAWRW